MSIAIRRTLVLVGVVLGAAAISVSSFGFWTADGTGSAAAAVADLGAPGAPSASVTGASATLQWSAASAPGPGAVGYWVERLDTSGSVWTNACGTSALAPTASLSCSDTPGDGTFVWRVTAIFASWTATGSESSAAVIDTAPPTGSVTAPASGTDVKGTVSVTSDSADAGSGVASAQFQTSPAGTGTWTDLGAADMSAPYAASWNTTAFPDGAYDLRVITTDLLGNAFTSDPATAVVADNTPPTVSVALAPGATGAYLSAGKVYFRATAAGSFGFVATVADSTSGPASATFPILSATGWTTHAAETVTAPAGGPYASTTFAWAPAASAPAAYSITGRDGSGSTAAAGITFAVDSTAPTGTVTAPLAAAIVRGTVSVTSSSADAGSGVASAQFQSSPAGAGSWTNLGAADTTTPYAVSWDTTTFADGLYDFRVITTDNVGNAFTSGAIAGVRVDNTAPAGSITAPAPSAIIKGTYTVTSDSSDGGSGVANALFQRSPAGANTWTSVATADTTAPYTASWATADGLYDLRVTTTDKAGNTFISPIITNVRADNTAPSGSVTSPAAAANVHGSVTIAVSSADAGSGVASVNVQSVPHGLTTWTTVGPAPASAPYTVSWDTTSYSDGLYDLRVITTDNAANVTTSATIASVRVDNTAPTGAITVPAAGGNLRGAVTLTSDSADAGSGVASALFQRSPAGADTWTNVAAADTTTPFQAGWTTTTPGDGLYDLRVVTTDKAGNAFTSAVTSGVRVDNTAPTAATVVASGATGAFQSGARIYFKSNAAGSFSLVSTVTDAGSGAASASFPLLTATGWTHAAELDTTPVGGPYSSSAFSWTSGAAAPGTYTVTMADAAGNTATSALTFTADATAPTGAVTAPIAAANVRGSVSVTSSSADAGSGVASAQFQISPAGAGTWSNLGAADTVTPYAATWDTTAYSEGLYDLRVVATDNVGTAFTSPTIANVRVDNTAPTGAITAPLANTFVSGASVAVSANSADTGSGVASAQFQTAPHGSGTWSNLGAADVATPFAVTWNTTTFANGQYDLRVVTTDKAGNAFTSASVMVEVQNGAPTATAVQLLDNGGVPGKAEQGDQIVVTFSQSLRVSTLCSVWSGDFSDQLLATPGDVTVTLADGGAANDTLTMASTTCALHFGAVNLGATGYVAGGTSTFSGSTPADASTVAWDASTHTLTATLGRRGGTGTPGAVASSNGIYTPDSALKSGFGTTITGTCSTGTVPLF